MAAAADNGDLRGSSVPETIVAIATPPGAGGVGIVRLSGPEARQIAGALCAKSLDEVRPRSLVPVVLRLDNGLGDEALLVHMPAPRSYTGEDVAELHAHGSPLVLDAIVRSATQKGARLAEPGEFTKRAFLNGRMDLTQAEAVSDLIYAKTHGAARSAHRHLAGGLGETVSALRDRLVHLLAELEAGLDFSEEELDLPTHDEYLLRVRCMTEEVDGLLATAHAGMLLRSGATVVLVGKPNVGKSSLFNALLRHERAIVTEEAGTTRDSLDAEIDLDGVPLRLVDTAGIRDTASTAEALGVQRSQAAMAEADVVLWVVDRSQPLSTDDYCVETELLSRTLVLYNKADLDDAGDRVAEQVQASVELSAHTGEGMDALHAELRRALRLGEASYADSPMLARERHVACMRRMRDSLGAAADGLQGGVALDCIAVDLRAALDALGSITGHTTTDDVLDVIFSEFCIGK